MAQMPQLQITGVDSLQLAEVPLPSPGPADIVVQVEQCGICGSDLGYLAMGGLLGPGRPMPLGHELWGKVHSVGSEVTHFNTGQHVVVNPMAGDNRIGNGGPEGGFAPQLLVRNAQQHEDSILVLPDSLSPELGALVEPLSVSMHGLRRARAGAKDKLVIFGAGPIGLGCVLVARYLGIEHIAVVDQSEFRLELASQLGASTVPASTENIGDALCAIHGSTSSTFGDTLPDASIYIEATGAGAVLEQITNLAAPGARIALLGLHKAPQLLSPLLIMAKELELIGAMAYPDEFPRVLEMLESGRIDCSAMVTHRFALSDYENAFRQAQDAHSAGKVLVDCQR